MSITPEQAADMVAKAVAAAKANAEPPAEPPTYSRAQLEAAVEGGKITKAEADAIWDTQSQRQTQRLVADTVKTVLTETQQQTTVDSRIAEYQALKPEVMKADSPERARVKQQYDYLVSIGQPATKSTELAALTMCYGSLDALKAAHAATRDDETLMDVGGGTPPAGGGDGNDGPKTKLSARERAHYQKLIDKGMYRSWADVDKEMEYANGRVRQNARARAA